MSEVQVRSCIDPFRSEKDGLCSKKSRQSASRCTLPASTIARYFCKTIFEPVSPAELMRGEVETMRTIKTQAQIISLHFVFILKKLILPIISSRQCQTVWCMCHGASASDSDVTETQPNLILAVENLIKTRNNSSTA